MRRLSCLLGFGLTSLLATTVWAQGLRSFPADARRAQLEPAETGRVLLDGRAYALSPGAQIRDTANRIVMPVALVGPVLARFQLDAQGYVHRIWVLTEDEARLRTAADRR